MTSSTLTATLMRTGGLLLFAAVVAGTRGQQPIIRLADPLDRGWNVL